MNKQVKVTIDRCGRPTVVAEGFVGDECLKATAPIEKALTDGAGTDRQFSPDYYANKGQHVQNELRNW